jgi:hypothetical protein
MEKKISLNLPRVLITSLIIIIMDFLLIAIIVMGYAIKLSIKVKGQPSQVEINKFAMMIGSQLGPIIGYFLVFIGAFRVSLKVKSSPVINGVAVGIIISLIILIFSKAIDLFLIGDILLTILAGWIGGYFGYKLKEKRKR